MHSSARSAASASSCKTRPSACSARTRAQYHTFYDPPVNLQKTILAGTFGLLIAAIILVVYGSTQLPEPRFTGRLHDLLPAAPSGWTMKEKPIADSEELKQAVGELLNYDDGVFVDYTNTSGDRLSVYIAYWTPGKMSHRLVAGHTPDICWEAAGWIKTKAGPTPELSIRSASSHSLELPTSTQIPPGEDRIFTAQATTEYVWFWHIVGDHIKSYGTGYTPKWYAPLTDLLEQGLNQREEQFFIRLSSKTPLLKLDSGPLLPEVLARLPWPASP